MFHAFKKIINPASGVFFTIVCGFGMGSGVFMNYGAVYLQEEMGASSAMIGRCSVNNGVNIISVKSEINRNFLEYINIIFAT